MPSLRSPLLLVLFATSCCTFAASSPAGDWPQYRGPMRNDISRGDGAPAIVARRRPEAALDVRRDGHRIRRTGRRRQSTVCARRSRRRLLPDRIELPTAADGKPREAWALRQSAAS